MRHLENGKGPGVGSAGHVLLLPRLRVAGQEDACRAVTQENGNRVVVGLGEELARWRRDDVRPHPSPVHPVAGANHLDLGALLAHAHKKRVVAQRALGVARGVDHLSLREAGRYPPEKGYGASRAVLLLASYLPSGVRRSIQSSASARVRSASGLPMRFSRRSTPFSPRHSVARVLRRSTWLLRAFCERPLEGVSCARPLSST